MSEPLPEVPADQPLDELPAFAELRDDHHLVVPVTREDHPDTP